LKNRDSPMTLSLWGKPKIVRFPSIPLFPQDQFRKRYINKLNDSSTICPYTLRRTSTSVGSARMQKKWRSIWIWLCAGLVVGCQQTGSSGSPSTYILTPGSLTNGSMTPATATSVLAGVATTITATPASSYIFSNWSANPTVKIGRAHV
jgi:hypothetical protein